MLATLFLGSREFTNPILYNSSANCFFIFINICNIKFYMLLVTQNDNFIEFSQKSKILEIYLKLEVFTGIMVTVPTLHSKLQYYMIILLNFHNIMKTKKSI